MSEVALLNPQQEMEGAKALLLHAKEALARKEAVLLGNVLERDEYMKTIGAAIALRDLCDGLDRKYRGMINK